MKNMQEELHTAATCTSFAKKEIRERDVEKHLKDVVRSLGGEIRKVVWAGRANAPDRFVMLYNVYYLGTKRIRMPAQSFFVELKAPGEKPTAGQLREHERMRACGNRVEVVDSLEGVEALFK